MSATMDWPRKWRLGVPYQGSKNQIAREIISILPRGKRFVDLFAGGCAMTHAAMISGKYDTFLVNDIHGFGVRLFMDAISGRCNGRWKEWVSREEFFAKRDSDPLVSLCWSFGNNGRDYLYGKDIECAKRKAHEEQLNGCQSYRQVESLERVQALERIQALERVQALKRADGYFHDYREYEYTEGDVVFCDPPYENTKGYNAGKFNNAAFWAWVDTRDYPVFVSEYNAPKGFTPIWTKGKVQLFVGNDQATHQYHAKTMAVERVFVADRYAADYQTDLFLGLNKGTMQ